MTSFAGRSVIKCMCMYFPYLVHCMRIFYRLLRLVYLVVSGYGNLTLCVLYFVLVLGNFLIGITSFSGFTFLIAFSPLNAILAHRS